MGILKDGKTLGFWALILAIPYRGRAIPCGLITYSSRTIAEQGDSRNRNFFWTFATLKDLLGERPLVLDREFSLWSPKAFTWAIILPSSGISKGERVAYRDVWCRNKVRVHLIGVWQKGSSEPLWGMIDLEPEEGLRIYLKRMKFNKMFRDGKSLLGMGRLMNKRWVYMEKMLALFLLVYAVAYLIGERLCDFLYDEPIGARRGLDSQESAAEAREEMETVFGSVCSTQTAMVAIDSGLGENCERGLDHLYCHRPPCPN